METPIEPRFQVSESAQEIRLVSAEPRSKRRKRTRLSRWMYRFGKTKSTAIAISDFSDDEEATDISIPLESMDGDDSVLSESGHKGNGGDNHRPIEVKPFKRMYFHGFPCDGQLGEGGNQYQVVSDKEDEWKNDQTVCKPCEPAEDGIQDSTTKCMALTLRGNPCMHEAVDDSFFCTRHENYGSKVKKLVQKRLNEDEKTNCMDIPFTGRNGQYRCIGLNNRGELCGNQAVNDTVYCYTHAEVIYEVSGGATAETELDNSTDDRSESSSAKSCSTVSDEETGDSGPRPFKYKEFIQMWTDGEEYFGEGTDEIESTRRVRGANSRVSPEDTDGQLKAQYGRLLPSAMKILMSKVLQLKREDVFLDIGHGIGNACIQAAFTFGCEARGIEVVADRNSVAEVFRDHLQSQAKENAGDRVVGDIRLKHGRLEDIEYRDFLTQGVTRAYVNNFNGVFADRSSKGNQKWYLDDYVAGLFALMKPGTLMITLHPLNLGPTREEANDSRKKQGLSESDNASFYEVERILLGKACDTVKWTQMSGNRNNIYIYKHTRLDQESEESVFLCCNPSCKFAKDEVPISATALNDEDRVVMNHCECKITAKNLRRHTRKSYS
eukprot:CAMPEP_0113625038 /NCGR_PEP_ID=MMETSP0017_2-20120614/12923_1 /TAXON_ID=2856 /ORGANISM="Cylindrotheca closterium" /LENGTH=607 /DNA_ID=CAMNT_0000535119 /DNA_START=14 /DNA_END=1837 /DNA_ORIENTATION=+ /assembly_acc=CAM_ASM_000147